MLKQKVASFVVLLLLATLLAGCQFIGNTPPQSSPIPTPSPSATIEPTANPNQSSIKLEVPSGSQTVSSPFTIRGQAPGSWFFEGQIVGKLINPQGEIITTAPLMAEGEWMTIDLVTFEGAMSYPQFEKPISATLRIENDNPSGLEEMQKYAEFSITLQ